MCHNEECMIDNVYKAMNKLEDLKDKEQISEEDYSIIMPVLDDRFSPNER